MLLSGSDSRESKESASTTEELELELEALDIADEPLELEGGDEVENEELAKKLLDDQGMFVSTLRYCEDFIFFLIFVSVSFCAEQEDEEPNTGSHLKLIVDAFIQQLPNCVNRDLIDKVRTSPLLLSKICCFKAKGLSCKSVILPAGCHGLLHEHEHQI